MSSGRAFKNNGALIEKLPFVSPNISLAVVCDWDPTVICETLKWDSWDSQKSETKEDNKYFVYILQ